MRIQRAVYSVVLAAALVAVLGDGRAAAQAPNDHDLAIVNATADLSGGTITIQGRNFGPPYVTLNGWALTVLPGSTDQLIVAAIPAGFDPVAYPGSYRLSVWTIGKNGKLKDGKKDYDQFDLTIGATGLQGPKGDTGETGAVGPVGPDGPVGATGPQGPIGPTGAVGPVGPQGAVGPVGPTGAVGPVGPTGAVGPVGPTGAVGPVGPQGAVGPVGPQGAVGQVGPQGAVGPVGPVGPDGPVGATGPQGPVGPQGAVGPIGPQGPMGPEGPGCQMEACPQTGVTTLTCGTTAVEIACIPPPPVATAFHFSNADALFQANSFLGSSFGGRIWFSVVDDLGNPVPGITLTGTWTYTPPSSSVCSGPPATTCTSNSSGVCRLDAPCVTGSWSVIAPLSFTISTVTPASGGVPYDPSANRVFTRIVQFPLTGLTFDGTTLSIY